MLEVGRGSGIFSFYATCKGTDLSVVLEPLFECSDKSTEDAFIKMEQSLSINSEVKLVREIFGKFAFDTTFMSYFLNNHLSFGNDSTLV